MNDTGRKNSSVLNGIPIDQLTAIIGEENVNKILDTIEGVSYSESALNGVASEVDAADKKIATLSELTEKIANMSNEDLSELIKSMNAETDKRGSNGPLTNEQVKFINQAKAQQIADAMVAADNAKHPWKFSMNQMAASLKAMKQIPNQMRENIAIANAAGLDCNSALKNAANAAIETTTNVLKVPKDMMVGGLAAVAETSAGIYHKAVGNVVKEWEKAKSFTNNAIHKITKGLDIGLEAMSLGGWSRFCSKMEAKHYDIKSSMILDDSKNMSLKESASVMFHKLHTKMQGNFYTAVSGYDLSSASGGTQFREDNKKAFDDHIDYWKDVKQKVWGDKFTDMAKGLPLTDHFGVASPSDISHAKMEQLKENLHKDITKTKEFIDDFKASTVSFAKEAPGKIKDAFKHAGEAIHDIAIDVAIGGVKAITKGQVGLLNGVTSLVEKVDLGCSSCKRVCDTAVKNAKDTIRESQAKENYLHADLKAMKDQQKAPKTVELPEDLANIKGQLEAATPSKEIVKAIKLLDKSVEKGQKKENFKTTLGNVWTGVKNAGMVVTDKINISHCKDTIASAEFIKDAAEKKSKLFEKPIKQLNKAETSLDNTKAIIQEKSNTRVSKLEAMKKGVKKNPPDGSDGPGGRAAKKLDDAFPLDEVLNQSGVKKNPPDGSGEENKEEVKVDVCD